MEDITESDDPKLSKCEKKNNKYINKWGDWPHGVFTGIPKFLKWVGKLGVSYMRSSYKDLDTNLPISEPYFKRDVDKYSENTSLIKATWLGHASVLVEIEGFRILCDPIFSKSCSPAIGFSRYRDVPCKVNDLPLIDAVVISHNHYDHMDVQTIADLSDLQRDIKWLIPDGDMQNVSQMAVPGTKIIEMKWWNEYTLRKAEGEKSLTIAFTPSQHWSNRGMFDAFKSLWGSWAFIGKEKRFWFGGDTGYCGAFKEIGYKYGPFDGAAIPIGAYKPRDFLKFQHSDPNDAVLIHQDIGSKMSFGIHWGTFALTEEPYFEPKLILDDIIKEKKEFFNQDIRFFTINHGETLVIQNDTEYKILTSLSGSKQNINKDDFANDGAKT